MDEISVLIASANSEGSGESVHIESVHMHRLARDFAARILNEDMHMKTRAKI